MKSIIKGQGNKSEYPCLKTSDEGTVVLFKSPRRGMVVYSSEIYRIGETSDNWLEHPNFKLFTGTIELSN